MILYCVQNEEAKEKAYTAMLENDKFTAIIEKMRREYEERMNERVNSLLLIPSSFINMRTVPKDPIGFKNQLFHILKYFDFFVLKDWNDTCLRSEITTANKDKDHAEESLRNVMKEREGEKMKNEETINELTTKVDNAVSSPPPPMCNQEMNHGYCRKRNCAIFNLFIKMK